MRRASRALTGLAVVLGIAPALVVPNASCSLPYAYRGPNVSTGAREILACPSVVERDLGPIPGSASWRRFAVDGCTRHAHLWVNRACDTCLTWSRGLEDRAALAFSCPAEQISVRGSGDTVRLDGCGQALLYDWSWTNEEWIAEPPPMHAWVPQAPAPAASSWSSPQSPLRPEYPSRGTTLATPSG